MLKVAYYKTIPVKKLESIVKDSYSVSEVLKKLGYITFTGTTFKYFKKYLKEVKIDSSHFLQTGRRTIDNEQRKPLREKDIFKKNSSITRTKVKEYVLRHNLIEHKCSVCQCNPKWRGKQLVLILDHINGVPNDNRLKNLRFLCPNCNSQTDTFGSKNSLHINKDKKRLFAKKVKEFSLSKEHFIKELKKQEGAIKSAKNLNITTYEFNQICKMYNLNEKDYYLCNNCGSKKKTRDKNRSCLKCSPSYTKKFIVDKKDLEKMLQKMSIVSIGRYFKVSDNTIRKRAKKLGIKIPKFPVGYWLKR